jgi:hypothetical protein
MSGSGAVILKTSLTVLLSDVKHQTLQPAEEDGGCDIDILMMGAFLAWTLNFLILWVLGGAAYPS